MPQSSQPLVSVVIPCYNAADLVGDAIRSALAQTYSRVEVLVVDDGSTDDSAAVARSFGERVQLIQTPNRGACAARNLGLELTAGELIQFLDADDLLHPEKLTAQVELAHLTADHLVFTLGEVVPANHPLDRIYKRPYRGQDPVEFALTGVIQTSAPLHHRANLERVGGFRPELPCSQEWDLHLRLACLGLKLMQVPRVLFTIRRRAGSLSSDVRNVLDQRFEIVRNATSQLAATGELTDHRREMLAACVTSAARAYFRMGLPERGYHLLDAARGIDSTGGDRLAYSRLARAARRLLGASLLDRLGAVYRDLRA